MTKDNDIKDYILDNYRTISEEPIDFILEMLVKRKDVFFDGQNDIIDSYKIEWFGDDYEMYVKFKIAFR